MKLFSSIYDFYSTKKTVVTIGTFDGVHIGHKKIIQKIVQNCEKTDCESVLLTFFPHPRMVLQDGQDLKLLNTIEEKITLLKETGLQNLIIHPFDYEFSRLTAEAFVEDILIKKLNIQKIIIGHDHRFGRNRTADINDLIQFAAVYGFEVEQISAQEINEISVSSTKIRTALNEGNIQLANDYLNYYYLLTGTVVKGKQLGRTIGFPTANLNINENYKLIPKIGVYIVKSIYNTKTVWGMMNIGYNPTVGGTTFSIEIHFLNFNEDLYGQKLSISVVASIRDEQKFESVTALQEQLFKDKEFTISYQQNHGM